MDKSKRNEIKQNYKQTLRPMGVYQIQNKVNGKMLVGSYMNLDGIFNRHKFQLQMGVHKNKELQKDWKEYGEQNFTFEVLEYLKPKEDPFYKYYSEDVKKLEEKWLTKFQPYGDKGYNKASDTK